MMMSGDLVPVWGVAGLLDGITDRFQPAGMRVVAIGADDPRPVHAALEERAGDEDLLAHPGRRRK
jgi:hypothetical protein